MGKLTHLLQGKAIGDTAELLFGKSAMELFLAQAPPHPNLYGQLAFISWNLQRSPLEEEVLMYCPYTHPFSRLNLSTTFSNSLSFSVTHIAY